MPNNAILIRNFHRELKEIAKNVGYSFVYDSLNLIRVYIPCKDIVINIAKSAVDNLENLDTGKNVLFVATPPMFKIDDVFVSRWLQHIPFAKYAALQMAKQLHSNIPIDAISFFSGENNATHHPKFAEHFFYKALGISDVMVMAGLLGQYQIYQSPLTKSYYFSYLEMVRHYGARFTEEERQLCMAVFDLFLAEFQEKIKLKDDISFLPCLTDVYLTSGQLTLIKACFDVKMTGQEVTPQSVSYQLRPQDDPTKTKIHNDFYKLKEKALEQFKSDPVIYKQLYDKFKFEHLTEIFKTYAYFGLYPADKKPPAPKRPWSLNVLCCHPSQYQYLSNLFVRLNNPS